MVKQNLSRREVTCCQLFRDEAKELFHERKVRGELLGRFFSLYNGVAPPIYVPATSFKLMTLWNIMVDEYLHSKNASVTIKQTSLPVSSKKVKRRKLKSLVMHCEKSSTSQIGFYLIRIWMLNTLCFHRLIGAIAIRKAFPLKFFHKKAFLWQFDKIKSKFLFTHRLFFYKNKMILA